MHCNGISSFYTEKDTYIHTHTHTHTHRNNKNSFPGGAFGVNWRFHLRAFFFQLTFFLTSSLRSANHPLCEFRSHSIPEKAQYPSYTMGQSTTRIGYRKSFFRR